MLDRTTVTTTPSLSGRITRSAVRRAVERAAGGRVVDGPFRGMRLLLPTYAPYQLGTYELELAGAIRRIAADPPSRVVNVGTSDGYFAVGLARLLPGVPIVGFELLDAVRERCRTLSRLNGVAERLTLEGRCTPAALDAALARTARPLVVMDVEGGEVDLLDPAAVPALSHATVLVEVHDGIRAGGGDAIRARFARTHALEVLVARPRTAADFPAGFLPWLPRIAPESCRALMVEERIGTQEWFVLTPR